MRMLLWTGVVLLLHCYNIEVVENPPGSNLCEQDRSYTLSSLSNMPTTPSDFEQLSASSTYTISNSSCPGIPNVNNATGPSFNVKRASSNFYLASFTEPNLNLTLSLSTSGSTETISPQNIDISNSFCGVELQNFTGTLTYSATPSITFSYHVVYTNLDNCSAF